MESLQPLGDQAALAACRDEAAALCLADAVAARERVMIACHNDGECKRLHEVLASGRLASPTGCAWSSAASAPASGWSIPSAWWCWAARSCSTATAGPTRPLSPASPARPTERGSPPTWQCWRPPCVPTPYRGRAGLCSSACWRGRRGGGFGCGSTTCRATRLCAGAGPVLADRPCLRTIRAICETISDFTFLLCDAKPAPPGQGLQKRLDFQAFSLAPACRPAAIRAVFAVFTGRSVQEPCVWFIIAKQPAVGDGDGDLAPPSAGRIPTGSDVTI